MKRSPNMRKFLNLTKYVNIKSFLKALAVVLSAILIFQIVQSGILAAPIPVRNAIGGGRAIGLEASPLDRESIEEDDYDALIMGEMAGLREESVKHFRKTDGTFVATQYNEPVHYETEDGEWEDIDAALVLEETDEGEEVYAARALPSPISLPNTFADGQRILIEKDGRTISFGVSAFNIGTVFDGQETEQGIGQSEETTTEAASTTTAYFSAYEPTTVPATTVMETTTETETTEDEATIEADEATEEETSEPETTTEATTEATTETTTETTSETEPAQQENETTEDKKPTRQAVNFEQKARIIAAEEAFSAEAKLEIERPTEGLSEIEKIRQANEDFMRVEPSKSAVVYEDLFDGADLEYIIEPTRLKESIIIKEQKEYYSYIFDIDFGGLIPVPQADGSIYLLNPETNALAAVLEAPYMVDANGEYSDAVTMELATWEDHYVLTVTADAGWGNADGRAWPIMIDPTFNLNPNEMTISYTPAPYISAYGSNYTHSWAYITFSLPTLPAGATITDAALYTAISNPTSYSVGGVDIYEGQVNLATATQAMLLSTAGFSVFSQTGSPGTSNISRRFNMTKAALYWYYYRASNPVSITVGARSTSLLFPSKGHITLNAAATYYTVSYTNNVGLEDYWSYETIDLGRSGQVHVNHLNGLLTYVHPDLQLDGNRMPFSLSHTFTSQRPYEPGIFNAISSGFYGYSNAVNKPVTAAMSFMEYMERAYMPYAPYSFYRLIDSDGSAQYFAEQGDGIFVHENDESLVLDTNGRFFTLTDGQGTVKRYDDYYYGRLTETEDANGNVTTINFGRLEVLEDLSLWGNGLVDENGDIIELDYNAFLTGTPPVFSSMGEIIEYIIMFTLDQCIALGVQRVYNYIGMVRSVTDPAGREIKFEYDYGEPILYPENNPQIEAYICPSFLSAIVESSGRRSELSCELDNPNEGFESDGLVRFAYPDGRETSYYFSGNETIGAYGPSGRRVDYINAADGSRLEIAYASDDENDPQFQIVTGLEHWSREKGDTTRELLKAVEFDRSAMGVTVVNDLTDQIDPTSRSYVFDYFGRLVNAWDQDMVANYAQYNFESGNPNHVSLVSAAQPMIDNLARGHSFEGSGGDWIMESASINPGTAQVTDAVAYMGEYSLEIVNPSQNISTAAVQTYAGAEPGKSYTLSAYALLPVELDTLSGGARLTLTATRGGILPGTVEAHSQFILSAENWVRYDVTVEIPDNWPSATLEARLAVEHAVGGILFDAVQLEPGGSANDYNLLENGRFAALTSGAPDGWTGENLTVGDEVQPDGTMRIAGEAETEKSVSQSVRVDAKAGQTIVFNAFASANAGMDDEESRFGAALAADNNTDEPVYAPFSPTVFGETQMTGGALRLTEDCETVTLSLVYDNQINEAFFGGAALYVGNFGETFDYYTETGLLKSVSNDFGGSIQLQYDSNLNPNKILQQHMGETLKEIDITYDDYHNIIQTQASDITTNYFYNPESIEQMNQDGRATYGVITDIISTAEELVTFESMTYTPDFNYLASYTDARGMTSAFGYDMLSGRLLSATDPNGNTVEYMYSIVPVIEEVGVGVYETYTVEQVSVSGRAETNGPPVTTSFCSTQGVLRVILRGDDLNDLINGSGGDFHYRMEYDELGRVAGVNAGGNPLVANSYDTRQRLSGQTYANGDTYSLLYDSKDRVVGEKYGGGIGNEPDFGYTYNQKNQLSSLVDRENDTLWSYGYDVSGRLVSMAGSNGALARFEHNAKTDKLSRLTVSQNGGILTDVSHVYADDGRPVGAALHGMGESALAYGYDGLNRLRYANLEAGGLSLEHNYSYIDSSYMGVDGIATGLVGQLQLQKWDAVGFDVLREYTYSYDGLGNIESVTDGDGNVTRYAYDGLNRLVREDDELRDVTTTFSYDGGGNLLAKTTYEYTLDSLGSPLGTIVYDYTNPAWADQLTAYDGSAITYDQMGNPTGYAGYTFAWHRGRQLAGISGNGLTASYKYGPDGLRTEKTVNNVTTKYTWVGGLLISQTDGTDTLNFTYDANGRAIGAEYVGVGYFYYLYNLQGDVVAVVGEDGLVYGEYVYDAWGNVISATGIAPEVNPIRYRGYYYDAEIGCYYLQSRYYVPEWGRFLNADCMLIAGNVLTASNMYVYANDNPVMMVDKTGQQADWIDAIDWGKIGFYAFVGFGIVVAFPFVMAFNIIPLMTQEDFDNLNQLVNVVVGVLGKLLGGAVSILGGINWGGLLGSLFKFVAAIFGAFVEIIGRLLGRSKGNTPTFSIDGTGYFLFGQDGSSSSSGMNSSPSMQAQSIYDFFIGDPSSKTKVESAVLFYNANEFGVPFLAKATLTANLGAYPNATVTWTLSGSSNITKEEKNGNKSVEVTAANGIGKATLTARIKVGDEESSVSATIVSMQLGPFIGGVTQKQIVIGPLPQDYGIGNLIGSPPNVASLQSSTELAGVGSYGNYYLIVAYPGKLVSGFAKKEDVRVDTIYVPQNGDLGTQIRFMHYGANDLSSDIVKLREHAKNAERYDIANPEYYAQIDGRIVIATTSNIGGNFPVKIGDYVDVEIKTNNGVTSIYPCIIGEEKNLANPGCNEWGHNNGMNVVEIVYPNYSPPTGYNEPSNEVWGKEGTLRTISITKVGSYGNFK